ncbi:MAG TPA: BON domain-containing protein [Gammaproteobacteria bacterium]|nr:BON domain-containing protein [Gammaproteobacteria bacterium]
MRSSVVILSGLVLASMVTITACSKKPKPESATDHFKRGASEMAQGAKQAATEARNAVADSTITAHVKARLAANQGLSSFKIHVSTTNGVVHLTGTVGSDAAKQLAGQVASKTDDVRVVVNEIKVKGG